MPFKLKLIILPRQAQDKHTRGNSKKDDAFSAGLQGDAAYGLRVGSPPHVRAGEGEGRTPFSSVVSSQFDFRLEKSMNYQDRLGAFRKEISLQKKRN